MSVTTTINPPAKGNSGESKKKICYLCDNVCRSCHDGGGKFENNIRIWRG